ncbi:hypothetical protein [Risungbinella massiliensis]|uniref:hypothetical protein n=1 Tax=Risungbinella massiliensis TaxID=1329796 RepID=UPI0012B58775|nr:hypothetical protein [Risungbinella massiliensis]
MKKAMVLLLLGMCCAILSGCLLYDTDMENFRDPSLSENYPSPNSTDLQDTETIKD